MVRKKFLRQDYFRYKKLGTKWRRPKGLQSKQRISKVQKLRMPNIGYGKPKLMETKIISNQNQLEKDFNGIVLISSTVGLKKAKEILEKADSLGIKIANKRKILKNIKMKIKEEINKKEKKKEEKKEHKKEEVAKKEDKEIKEEKAEHEKKEESKEDKI